MIGRDRMASFAWWTLFAAAFGVIEATVVIYIRRLLHIPSGAGYVPFLNGATAAFGAPDITETLRKRGLLQVELTREASTILLLLAAACAERKSFRERMAKFCFTFAVWDLSYYAYLAVAAGYPRHWTDTDIYFLIPVAWIGPVWFPVLIAMPAMIGVAICLERAASHVPTSSVSAAASP